jgi:CRISPR-associated protein Csd1
MSVLAALARAYARLPDAPPFGYSTEKIGFLVSLHEDGGVAHVIDLRSTDKKPQPALIAVPQGKKRTVGVDPNFLWDKTAYALGVTAGEGKRTAQEHAAFRAKHAEWLAGTDDPGLLAFLRFLETWTPETFLALQWPAEMHDQNVIFCLESERLARIWLHDRPAAQAAWAQVTGAAASDPQICLVTGNAGPVARLHPSIKGVRDAQSSGASLVSFNLDAFTSYGHEQGDNAPVSEAAAFAYATALNRFLARNSGHCLQIGDASTVFWADCSEARLAAETEEMFLAWFGETQPAGPEKDAAETKEIAEKLAAIREGRPLARVAPELAEGVRFFVLGLSPNAARLSIRFYCEDDFGRIAANYQRFLADMAVEPPPLGTPGLWRHLVELAVQGKTENVPPTLAGDWMRAILTGAPYPLTLLSTALMRIRADGEVSALRAAILRAVLVRNHRQEAPMALDRDNRNKGYLLGRLFAVYEEIQRAALGKVNASIRDKFYGAASASPQKVFALLERGSASHLAKIRKESVGREVNLRRDVSGIMEMMAPSDAPFPAALSAEQQALFGLGFYHQHAEFFKPRPKADEAPAEVLDNTGETA